MSVFVGGGGWLSHEMPPNISDTDLTHSTREKVLADVAFSLTAEVGGDTLGEQTVAAYKCTDWQSKIKLIWLRSSIEE